MVTVLKLRLIKAWSEQILYPYTNLVEPTDKLSIRHLLKKLNLALTI